MLAADVTAALALPVFDNSAMDGYAVRADEVAGATVERPVKLPVAEEIPAGRTDIPALAAGTVHRIMTGLRSRPAQRRSCPWRRPMAGPTS